MKVLLCVAGMPYAQPAIELGVVVARMLQASVTLFHVVPRRASKAEGQQLLTKALEHISDLDVETRVRRGNASKKILTELSEGGYDLVVIGFNQQAGLAQQFMGSVATQLVRRSTVSVLIVRPCELEFKRILICTGGLDVADPVIQMGARLAKMAQAQTTLFHVVSPVPSMYTGLSEVEETLSELLQTDTPTAQHLRHGAEILDQHQVTAQLKLAHGVVRDEILREIRQGTYDLVIIGASGTAGRLKVWLVGDVTQQIVEHAPCSVLIVRPSSDLPV